MDGPSTKSFLLDTLVDDLTEQMMLIWRQIKAPLVVPLLRTTLVLCLTMSLMLFFERVYMGLVMALVKLFGKKPEKRFKWEPIKDDIELGKSAYPMLLVQIPMYNEKEEPELLRVDVERIRRQMQEVAVGNYRAFISVADALLAIRDEVFAIDKHLESMIHCYAGAMGIVEKEGFKKGE